MRIEDDVLDESHATRRFSDALKCGFGFLWGIVRLPLYAFLILLEPIVRTALCVLALLLVVVAFFFRFFSTLQNFPFWSMLACAISCVLGLMLYYGLIRLFAPFRD